jgi:hypothetical protein
MYVINLLDTVAEGIRQSKLICLPMPDRNNRN